MSLWSQSLYLGLYDYVDNQKEKAKCIISHLSMSVPRSWWELALETGQVNETHISIILELKAELSRMPDFEDINSGLLVALAFVEIPDNDPGLNTMDSQTKIKNHLRKAKKVLAENPNLAELGRIIDASVVLKTNAPICSK